MMIEPVIFGAVFVGIAGMIWLGVLQRRKMRANLAGLAARTGLQLIGGEQLLGGRMEVTGTRQGKPVRFWMFTTGSQKSRRFWIAVGAQPRQQSGFTFRIEPQGLATRMAEWFGAKEIQVGDRQFDDTWFIRTNAPEVFGAALVPEIRAKLMAAREAGAKGDFKLENGTVFYAEEGSFASEKSLARLEGLLPVLLDLADVAEVCAASQA